jgi:hypothetical protein
MGPLRRQAMSTEGHHSLHLRRGENSDVERADSKFRRAVLHRDTEEILECKKNKGSACCSAKMVGI